MYHNPVLIEACLEGLNIREDGIYVDVTFGGGGHAREILRRLSDKGRLIAFDQDDDALKNAIEDERFLLINQNFKFLQNFLRFHGIHKVDGILADLGVSSHQFDTGERGFSTRFDGPLDMRMNQNSVKTAAQIINTYEENDLANVFFLYGELKKSRQIAKIICNRRRDEQFQNVAELLDSIRHIAPKFKENQFFAKVLQAIRIEVNDELGALKEMLTQARTVLNPHGRLVVISYHSLEDRLVKYFIKSDNFEGKIEKDFFGNPQVSFKVITRKPIIPDKEEIAVNNRARSAKLRIAEKI
jgi:16S rRNA (cytosine1402-N4)-methyltransferase